VRCASFHSTSHISTWPSATWAKGQQLLLYIWASLKRDSASILTNEGPREYSRVKANLQYASATSHDSGSILLIPKPSFYIHLRGKNYRTMCKNLVFTHLRSTSLATFPPILIHVCRHNASWEPWVSTSTRASVRGTWHHSQPCRISPH